MPKLTERQMPAVADIRDIPDLMTVVDENSGMKPRTAYLDLRDKVLVGIDPGDTHVGWTEYVHDHTGQTTCVVAVEITPDEALYNLEGMADADRLYGIAYENFTLAPDKAEVQFGSEMTTSEMIGVIKWIVKVHNKVALEYGKPEQTIQLYKVSRNTKKAISRQMVARRIRRISGGQSSHVKDAEVIGWYPILYYADRE